ncbi:unnamed protein product [Schistosoma mattheei]|uniref:Uncharacterized protein n=1 Tax=Schistosoma mattheei TaxID=31246 RepID=A0AA85AY37_9TREM|nr:unnamed protein product [Schistosoma mattheei]
MSSNQGNKIDRYEIFRIRQGMRPRSNDEAYFDCSGSPMIDGFDHKIRVYNKKGATGNQRGVNSEQTYGSKNISDCSYQQDFDDNLGPLVTYGIDDEPKPGDNKLIWISEFIHNYKN